MQYVSKEYKAAMKQSARNKSYMKISLGLINQEAQASAKIQEGSFTYFTNTQTPLSQDEKVSKVYATLEQDFSKVNSAMYFLPRSGSGMKYYNAGLVTESTCTDEVKPEILIRFNSPDPLDIKGVTLEFGESYPSELEIITDEGTHTYLNNVSLFKTEDTFDNTTFMRIRALEMNKGIDRLRINSIIFGIGITLENDKIISAEYRSSMSPISEGLPSIDFSVTVENMDRYYNVDNEDSAINYMETGQQMSLYYGYTLNDGTIEWVKGGTLFMKEWSADDRTAKFGAVDTFEYMQDEYKRGKYRPEGISLYDLAADVFEDAGISPDFYWIDPYLERITVYNPLPSVNHKECLQLIANAGRSVLMQDRDGIITIKSSFEPDKAVSANQVAEYGSVDGLLDGEDYSEYAAYEQDYSRVTGQQYFMPRGEEPFLDVGYVSESISDSEGLFDENPIITITMESAYTFYNLTLEFGTIQPVEFIITTYNNGRRLKRFASRGIEETTVVYYSFIDTDEITIEFTKAKPNDRLHLKRIVFGETTDYKITYDDLTATPKGTKLEKIKELRVVRTIYANGTEQKDLTSEEITLAAGVQAVYEFDFGQAVYNLSAITSIDDTVVNYGAQIIDSSSYWCKVKITNPPQQDTSVILTVKGYEYNISNAQETISLNNTGTIMSWNNPLISSVEDAQNLVEWIGEYLRGGNKYELTYRGDPILDYNDIVFLESMYVDDLMVRLEEVGLNFSGSLKGTLVARRKI